MNPPTEISPSTQFLLDEINRRFDEADARFDRLFTRLQQRAHGCAPSSCNDDSGVVLDDALVTSNHLDAPHYVVQEVTQVCEEQHADGNQDLGERKPTVLPDGAPTSVLRLDSVERKYIIHGDAAFTDEPDPGAVADQATLDDAESPHRLAAALSDIVDLDRLSLLPDVFLRNIVSRLPLKDATRTTVLSRRWRPLCASPSKSLVCSVPRRVVCDIDEPLRSCVLRLDPDRCDVLRPRRFRKVRVVSGVVLMDARQRLLDPTHGYRAHDDRAVINALDFDPERIYDIYACDSFRIGPVECTLHAAPPRGFDGSLDDGLELGVAEVALATAAALRADAVDAAGGGPVAWEAVAGSAQTTCLTICLSGSHCFADVLSGANPVHYFLEVALYPYASWPLNSSLDALLRGVPSGLVWNLAVVWVAPSELAPTSPSWCSTAGPYYAKFVPASVAATPAPSSTSAMLLLRAYGPVPARAMSVLDDPGITAPLNRFVFQAAQDAVQFVPNSVELAHFHAELFLDADPECSTMSQSAHMFTSQWATLTSALVLHVRATVRGAVLSTQAVTIAPASMSSSRSTSAHELFGGLLSRYITMLFSAPMLDVLLLDCASTVYEGQRYQKMAESGSVRLCPPQLHQQGIFIYVLDTDVDLWSPWPPPQWFSVHIEIQSVGVKLRPTPWPSFYCYAALVQWIKSLVVADDILPKPPWLAFHSGTLFSVECNCSIKCGSFHRVHCPCLNGHTSDMFKLLQFSWLSSMGACSLVVLWYHLHLSASVSVSAYSDGLQLLFPVSVTGCALIQQRVQRKRGFLLEVSAHKSQVARSCTKCFLHEQDTCFLVERHIQVFSVYLVHEMLAAMVCCTVEEYNELSSPTVSAAWGQAAFQEGGNVSTCMCMEGCQMGPDCQTSNSYG